MALCLRRLLPLLGAIATLQVAALEAGPLRLIGAADQGEIVVTSPTPFDAATFQARIAAANSYAVAGLKYQPALLDARILIARDSDGRPVLHLEHLPADIERYDLLILFGDRDRLLLAEYRVDQRSGTREFAAAPAGSARYALPPAATTAPVLDRSAASARIDDADTEVRAALLAWAQAWSDRDFERYAAAYAPDHAGPQGSRAGWLAERRSRILGRSHIEVSIDALQVERQGSDKAVARFQQNYRSERLSERSRKTLTLARIGARWLITAESSTR